MLCKGAKELPSRDEWLYEVKQDGYRAMAVKDGKRVALFSRNGKPLRFPGVLETVSCMRVNSAVLAAEVKKLSLEGIVAKRRGSTYEPGERSGA